MTDRDSMIGLIFSAVQPLLKYMVPREGQVKDINDPEKKGRILIQIPSLGWDTNNKGAWCKPIDKNSLSTIKVNDWAIIQFVDGDPNFPIYIGKSNRIKDQLPKNYDGKSTTHVLFESPNDKIKSVYNEESDLLQIGKSDFRSSARKNDTVQITLSATDIQAIAVALLTTTAFLPTGTPPIPATTPVPPITDGIITSGSSQIEVGDK